MSKNSKPIASRGNFQARTMILGEAPGKEEQEENIFFVGPAGRELDTALETVGLSIDEDFFVHNIVLCRPLPPKGSRKQNRTPTKEEVEACNDNFKLVTSAHQPALIVLVGGVSAAAIMKNYPGRVGDIVGRFFSPNEHNLSVDADLYAIWHPAFILRNTERRKEWMQSLVRLRDYMLGRDLVRRER